jgi:hypothetical protein
MLASATTPGHQHECSDVLATRGLYRKPHTNDTPQVMVPVGEDTDNTEHTGEEGEEILTVNWKEDHLPERTYMWVNRGSVSVCPPTLIEPLSGVHF